MGYGVINGRGADKITVNGSVTTTSWWDLANIARSGGSQNNPVLVIGYKATSGVMYKITLLNSPHYHVSIHYNNGFTAWGIKILSPFTARNSDGFDPSGATNLTVNNSVIGDGDDEIAVGGSSAASNMTFENLLLSSGHGLSIGSITTSGVSNIYANNINFSGHAADGNQTGLHIKSDCGNGGTVSNVSYNNVCIQNVAQPLILDPNYNNPTSCGTINIPQYTNISYNNVTELAGSLSSITINFQGYSSSYVSTLSFNNVFLTSSSITATAKYDTIGLAGNVYPSKLQSLNTVSGSTGVSYTGSATENSTPAYACPTTGSANVFPQLVGELYAGYGTLNNVNQAFSVTDSTTITLKAMAEPTNSETSYSYSGEGSYTGVPAPSATVQFYDGATPVGSPVALAQNGTFASTTISLPSVGTHIYTAQYTGDSNYAAMTFGSLPVTVTVGAATQLAFSTPPTSSLQYGTAPGTVTVAVEDAAGNVTASTVSVTLTVTGPNTYSHTYTANAAGGTATFSLTSNLPATGSYNYAASSTGLTGASAGESVTAAILTVAAQPASRVFGAQNPSFTYAISGYVNGDTASVVSGAPTLTTTALRNSPAATYPIATAVGTLTAANYVFATISNTFTVTGGAPQAIMFPPLPAFASGASYQLAASTTSGLPASYSAFGPASISGSTLTVSGTGLVTVTASNPGNSNYAAAPSASQSFTAY
jgi:hypothetical protein